MENLTTAAPFEYIDTYLEQVEITPEMVQNLLNSPLPICKGWERDSYRHMTVFERGTISWGEVLTSPKYNFNYQAQEQLAHILDKLKQDRLKPKSMFKSICSLIYKLSIPKDFWVPKNQVVPEIGRTYLNNYIYTKFLQP